MHALSEKVRRGEPIPRTLRAILSAATPVTRFGMWLRLSKPRVRVPAQVISFGNLTVGGTGKTPAVIERARAEIAAGRRVAVLTRGYGGRESRSPIVGEPDTSIPLNWQVFGDEPALIARKVPSAVIVRGSDRIAAAQLAIERYGCNVLLLDDGFQYVRLERDENVVLIDATNPFGNGRLLPRGILREPVSALRRASHIMITHCDLASDLDRLLENLREICPDKPIRRTHHAPTGLWRPSDGSFLPLSAIRGQEVAVVCGIGNPDVFIKTVELLGAKISANRIFPDHHPYQPGDIPKASLLITTEKDAIRMNVPAENVLALCVELQDYV
ncbi:MAG: tetraacyldisaccharide 4'-kinase [Candidatus Hydrogenedentes bacterium]|nr:tetraacyldisaccharide 4'-kinase [Candidatus Hydrogenedentota bacterium]